MSDSLSQSKGDWKEIAIGDLCTISRGGSPRPIQDFIQDYGTPWLKIADAKADRRYIYETKEFIKPEGESKSRVVFPGDFILSNSATPGLPRFMKIRACIHDGWLLLRNFVDDIDQMFLHYLLVKEREALLIQGNGSIFTNLKTDILREHKVLIPRFEVQKAIASVLSSLDDKIDLLHRQNQTLEQMAETLFRQWFVEEADDGWEELTLYDLCEIRNGHAFKSKDYRESGHVIVRTKDFENGYVNTSDPVFLAEDLIDKFKKFQLNRKELLLVMVGASLGKSVIVTSDVLPALQNQNMWAFKAHNELHQYYLNYAVKDLIKENLFIASGSARSFFQKGSFYKFSVNLPNEELLMQANKYFDKFFRKIEANKIQINTLSSLRDTLLPKLMNGDVRVKN